MRFNVMPIVLVGMMASPAMAQSTPTSATAAQPVKDKKVCRRMEAVTGSIMGGRMVCHTKTEWTQIDEANGRAASDMLSRSQATIGGQTR